MSVHGLLENFQQCVQEIVDSARRAGMSSMHTFLTVKLDSDIFGPEDKVSAAWRATAPNEVDIGITCKRKAKVAQLDGPRKCTLVIN